MSSRFIIRWFSGRVTPCSAPITAVCRLRRSTLRSARPLAMRIGIRIVVQEDEDAVGVAEEPLILLNLEPGEGAAELGEERTAEELRQGEVIQLGKLRLELVFALARVRDADAEHVDERPAGVADRFENLAQALPAVVLDDDAGAGREVGLEIGVGAPEVAGGDVQTAVVQAARERLAFDQELDFEAGQQDLVEHPDRQLRLADRETPHSVLAPRCRTLDIGDKRPLYAYRLAVVGGG